MLLQPLLTAGTPEEDALLTPDEFKAYVTRLRRNVNRSLSLARVLARLWIGTIWMLICVGYFSRTWSDVRLAGTLLLAFALVSGLILCFIEHSIYKDKRTAERLLRFIATTQDARQLGTILDLYDAAGCSGGIWLEVHTAKRTAFVRLLPLLQPQHADTLNTQQREYLRRDLFRRRTSFNNGYWRGAEHCFLLLSALEQIGDKRDLPDVERLLKSPDITDEVRAAAKNCVQVIRERVAREKDKDVLLRADRKPEAVATLLRPSTEHADTPPQQLLRAATADEGNTPA